MELNKEKTVMMNLWRIKKDKIQTTDGDFDYVVERTDLKWWFDPSETNFYFFKTKKEAQEFVKKQEGVEGETK